MALAEKKQGLSQGRFKEKPDKTSSKEPPKDTSPYRGRPHFPTKEFRRWLESDEAFKATDLSKQERLKFGSHMSDPKMVGKLFEKSKGELKNIEPELKKGKYGAFKNLNPEDRKKVEKIYKGFFKK